MTMTDKTRPPWGQPSGSVSHTLQTENKSCKGRPNWTRIPEQSIVIDSWDDHKNDGSNHKVAMTIWTY